MAAGVALAILAAAPPTSSQSLEYSGSLQVSSGDYIFTQRTTSLLLFSGLSAAAGPFRLAASVPFIYQSTPFVSYTTGVLVPSGGPEHSDVSGRMGGGGRMGRSGGDVGEITLADTSVADDVGVGDVSPRTRNSSCWGWARHDRRYG